MKLLYTVNEVFSTSGYLQSQNKRYYNIPLYQRGYKWTKKEVNKLLVDINGFSPADEKFYCLQNITIVPNHDTFNVVDGQQRLTTLTLLLCYLGDCNLVENKLVFPDNSIRTQTNKFINEEIIHNNDLLEIEWDDFIKVKEDYDHQDIYHLYHAYKEIADWFTSTQISKLDFKNKLLNNVKIIVNKIESQSDEEEIFGNLNSKKIPLDGADLFRAILITRVASEESKRDANIKDIIQLNEKRVKIGWEFDVINNWWSQKNVQTYFFKFISIKSETASAELKLFDTQKHPINLLLFLFAESEGVSQLSLEFLETYNNTALALYKKIQRLHHTMLDWHSDREIYHFLGYIFAHTNTTFFLVWDLWNKSENRTDFIGLLKEEIELSIYKGDKEIDFCDFKIDWYNNDNKQLVKTLVLLDVISSLDNSQPFMNPSYFNKSQNDIEHIFPQNPESIKEKKEFIQFLNERISIKAFDLKNFEEKSQSEKYLQEAEKFIQEHISNVKVNSIGNLVLLYYSLNRSIGRSSYTKKRAAIIKHFNNGNYIQPHTFRVFVRYFMDDKTATKELEHWTNHDIEANATAIDNKIKAFFKTSTNE